MKLIDMHCDTLWKMMDLDKEGNLMENQCSINIPGMKKAGTLAQFFACFTYLGDYKAKGAYEKGYARILEMIRFLDQQINAFPDEIARACSRKEILRNESEGKISALLGVEDGGVLNGKMERLEELYRKGVRLVTLLWNHENCIGHPNSRRPGEMWQGLKPFGIQMVERMSELKMIVDVSHASDGTVRDVLEHARGAVIASHSNCRAVCPHPRNLTDEMIRAIANRGGIAGVNFYGPFLGTETESRISEITHHILHMIDVGGSSFPAIGTDFDGFDGMEVMDIPEVGSMERLWEALKKKGISERQLDMIWRRNALRVIP